MKKIYLFLLALKTAIVLSEPVAAIASEVIHLIQLLKECIEANCLAQFAWFLVLSITYNQLSRKVSNLFSTAKYQCDAALRACLFCIWTFCILIVLHRIFPHVFDKDTFGSYLNLTLVVACGVQFYIKEKLGND